jgi:hypothetical protein
MTGTPNCHACLLRSAGYPHSREPAEAIRSTGSSPGRIQRMFHAKRGNPSPPLAPPRDSNAVEKARQSAIQDSVGRLGSYCSTTYFASTHHLRSSIFRSVSRETGRMASSGFSPARSTCPHLLIPDSTGPDRSGGRWKSFLFLTGTLNDQACLRRSTGYPHSH